MSSVIILSDDLTGAGDSGVQFAKLGIPTVVAIDEGDIPVSAPPRSAIVINAESRSLSPDEARAKWSSILFSLNMSDYEIVLKKIDSTLRGNIGKEIEACMDTGLFEAAIVVPSYPQKGRRTVGGYHWMHENVLEDSEVATDPKFPIRESKVSRIIRRQWDHSVCEIELAELRNGSWRDRYEERRRHGENVFVFDSATEKDIERIVDGLYGRRVLWVGTAGLAKVLAMRYAGARRPQTKTKAVVFRGDAPVLAVAGSVSQVTREQVNELKHSGFAFVEVDPLIFLSECGKEERSAAETERLVAMSTGRLREGRDVVMSTDVSTEKREQVRAKLMADSSKSTSEDRIASGLGKMAARIVRETVLSGVILTGGDIAYNTCRHLGVRKLIIIDEVEEGLPLCLTDGEIVLPVVTKAGAFGDRRSMLNAAHAIRRFIRQGAGSEAESGNAHAGEGGSQ